MCRVREHIQAYTEHINLYIYCICILDGIHSCIYVRGIGKEV